MNRNRSIPILLTAALIAQSVIAGWGHSHVHLGGESHRHVHANGQHSHHQHGSHFSHTHAHGGIDSEATHDHAPLPSHPVDHEDCSICRHLALATVLNVDLDLLDIGSTVDFVANDESLLASAIRDGLYRPRAPPEFS